MRISEAVDEFTVDCRIRKLSVRTIRNYGVMLKLIRQHLESQAMPWTRPSVPACSVWRCKSKNHPLPSVRITQSGRGQSVPVRGLTPWD